MVNIPTDVIQLHVNMLNDKTRTSGYLAAIRKLVRPGDVVSGIKIFGLPVTIPDQELSKHTFAPGTLQNWQSWYNFDFAPLVKIVNRSFLNSLFGYFINPLYYA
jgi:hypothetical protein